MANKNDCMEPLENCDYDLPEYEIVPYEEGEKVYECPMCDDGYFWSRDDRECQSCDNIDADCIECTRYGEECTACDYDLIPSGDGLTCIDDFAFCVDYGKNDLGELTCFECIHQYYWNEEEGECTKTLVDNCDVSSSLSTCAECQNGYYLEFGGVDCKSIPPHQASACRWSPIPLTTEKGTGLVLSEDNQYRCPYCDAGFRYDEKGLTCLPCTDRCKRCNADNECLECEDFLEIKQGVCMESNGIDFCVQANPQNRSICLQCHHGYTLSPNKRACVKCYDDGDYQGCRHCQVDRISLEVTECLECIDNMELNLETGMCEFNECENEEYRTNFLPGYESTQPGSLGYGQLLQAAICDGDCIFNYGPFHVGCKQCIDEANPADWEFCSTCSFNLDGSVDECDSCAPGWVKKANGRGC